MDSFFFEVAYKSMTCGRRKHVSKEVHIEEDSLGCCDSQSEHDTRISHFQEEEQVHPLILCLLQKMMDPSMISLKSSKTSQVTSHTSNHTRDTSHCLEENTSVKPSSFIHSIWIVPRHQIKSFPCSTDCQKCKTIFDALWLLVSVMNSLNIFLLVDRVCHPVTPGVKDDLMLW